MNSWKIVTVEMTFTSSVAGPTRIMEKLSQRVFKSDEDIEDSYYHKRELIARCYGQNVYNCTQIGEILAGINQRLARRVGIQLMPLHDPTPPDLLKILKMADDELPRKIRQGCFLEKEQLKICRNNRP
ncbi:uncharacterized protein VTP21DRAFT_9637 [Calcarisporiella thermophila]|uniref:uncharacterized protein n=1 Tax=Calcarisporiella thermophila TaxID=911321 RepID=UPI003742FBDA